MATLWEQQSGNNVSVQGKPRMSVHLCRSGMAPHGQFGLSTGRWEYDKFPLLVDNSDVIWLTALSLFSFVTRV